MIRNLNQLNFRDFGTISRESGEPVDKPPRNLTLEEATHQLFLTTDRTRLWNISGMCVLSVQTPDGGFLAFYLDKAVWLLPGICFGLRAFGGPATVSIAANKEPENLPPQPDLPDPTLPQRLSVNRICTFFYQEKELGFLFPGESHPMAELTYVDRGSLHSVADGRDLILEQGDLALYRPNQWHMQYADIGVAPRFVTISFDLKGWDLTCLYDRVIHMPRQAFGLLQKMLQEQERMDEYSADMIISLLTQLLLTLCRESEVPSSDPAISNTTHSENAIIQRAQQYISTHVRQKLTVPIVAQNADVSPSYLTALFHKHLQISPGEYIRRIKLQESKQMIREDAMNFTEIAAALQYSTIHHFSRQFKEKFGMTPSEYAKSVR